MNTQTINLKKLLQIIPTNHPALRVVHFTQQEHPITELLYNLSDKYDIEYQINILDETLINHLQTKYQNINTKIVKFNLNRPKYMIQGKIYDFAFVTANIEDIDTFLQKIHPIIKNAGNIIFLIPKDIKTDIYVELLEKNYFVATSIMDDLLENENIIISRKMHGWGG